MCCIHFLQFFGTERPLTYQVLADSLCAPSANAPQESTRYTIFAFSGHSCSIPNGGWWSGTDDRRIPGTLDHPSMCPHGCPWQKGLCPQNELHRCYRGQTNATMRGNVEHKNSLASPILSVNITEDPMRRAPAQRPVLGREPHITALVKGSQSWQMQLSKKRKAACGVTISLLYRSEVRGRLYITFTWISWHALLLWPSMKYIYAQPHH